MWFMVGLTTQCLIVHCIRTERIPFLQSRAHPRMSIMSLVIASFGLALPWITPLADALEMVPPPPSFLAVVAANCAVYALLVLGVKKIYIYFFKQWL
jgi:Mg2+-importing ATPase